MEKGILRAIQNIFVFKDGTTRFDMIDLPLTHIRPDEIRVSVEKLRIARIHKRYPRYDLQTGRRSWNFMHRIFSYRIVALNTWSVLPGSWTICW